MMLFLFTVIAWVAAEDTSVYDVIGNETSLDYVWVPQEGCRSADEVGSISVECFVSGTQFSYKVNREATTVTLDYDKPSALNCTSLLEAKRLVDNYVLTDGQTGVQYYTIISVVLTNESLSCPLALLGRRNTEVLRLKRIYGELLPHHVDGIQGVRKLQMLNIENNLTTVPYSAMLRLTSLESATFTGGSFILKDEGEDKLLPKLKTLELSQGGLKTLPKRAFINTPALTLLLLYSNQIEYVDVDAFEGLTKLEQLSMAGNRMWTLPVDGFRFNPNLIRIDIYNNMFTNLTEGVFRGLKKLTNIYLHNNRGNLTLYGGVFSHLPSLSYLELSTASLSSVPADLVTDSPLLQVINLSNNRLVSLPPHIFSANASSAIASIDLSNNLLNTLYKEQFSKLTSLKMLNLNNNRVSNLSAGVFSDLSSLEVLNLKSNKIDMLRKFMFLGLNKLRGLYLDGNQIKIIEPGVFDVLRDLQVLSISHNNLTISKTMNTDAATDDFVSYGRDAGFESRTPFYFSRFRPLRALTTLNLAGNQVSVVCDDWQDEMFHLRTLNLSYNNFSRLTAEDTYFASDVMVDFSNNNIRVINLFHYTSALPTESRPLLRLQGNPFNCTCDLYPFLSASDAAPRLELGAAACAAPPALQGASLAALNLNDLTCATQCPPPCASCTARPASRRLELTCAALTDLPKLPPALDAYTLRLTNSSIAHTVLQFLPPGLDLVDLSNLNLTTPPEPLTTISNITVDLRNNSLSTVPAAVLNAGAAIYLAGNPIECTCENRADLQVAGRHLSSILDFDMIQCLGGRELAGAARAAAAGELCAKRVAVLAIASVVASLILTLALTAFLYKRRTRLQILCRKYFPQLAQELNTHKYDVFVSYAYSDEGYVQTQVIPELEGGKGGLRLCVHSRDWRFGERIPQQGEKSVREATLTLALVSPEYLKSAWCAQELCLAHSRGALLILVLDDAALNSTTAAQSPAHTLIREYIRANTYVRASNPRVWDKVREAVFKRRALPNPVSLSEDKPRGLDTRLTIDGKIVNAALSRV